jgi:hypothetical protein|tara:strand:- start:338 stop:727 length:390 start_codon:yes stop_codon:yes gene_type:complete
MIKKIVIGVTGRQKIGNWKIPQKIQTAICHASANSTKEKISFMITEYHQSSGIPNLLKYLKSNKKKIKKIIFVSIFQLGKKKIEIMDNYKKIKKYDCYFFAENINNQSKNIKQIDNFLSFALKLKFYQK